MEYRDTWNYKKSSEMKTWEKVMFLHETSQVPDDYDYTISIVVAYIFERDAENAIKNMEKYASEQTMRENIDTFLECAIDNDCYEVTAFLIDYKYNHGLFADKDWRL